MKTKRVLFLLVYLLAFVIGFASALPAYVDSSFVLQFLAVDWIGFYFALTSFFCMIMVLFIPDILRSFSNFRTTIVTALVFIASIFGMITQTSPWAVLGFFAVYQVSLFLLAFHLDVMLEDISSDISTGRIRTMFLTIMNLAWVLSPFLSGTIAAHGDYRFIYFLCLFLVITFLFLLLFFRRSLQDRVPYFHRPVGVMLSLVLHKQDLRNAFFIGFALRIFYVFMVLYMPLHLFDLGFSWNQIGLIFTIMLIPFVLIQFPAGYFADTKFGEKELLNIGLVFMFLSVVMIFVLRTPNFALWAFVLFISRIGAALVEAMHEVYFFKQVNKKDADLINLFRDVTPAAWIIASLASAAILHFFALPALFVFLGIVLLIAFIPALRLHDTQ